MGWAAYDKGPIDLWSLLIGLIFIVIIILVGLGIVYWILQGGGIVKGIEIKNDTIRDIYLVVSESKKKISFKIVDYY